MQAVIMAGGKGTRLSSIITDIPKPMVSINGKPLLQYQIENLKQAGVNEIVMVIGHLGHVIKEYFGDGRTFGVSITYYNEDTPLGTAGALSCLQNKLEETFLLVFGDLFLNINFERFFNYHLKHKGIATLYAHPNSHPHDSDILVIDESNRVIEWNYKNSIRTSDYKNLVNAGVYVLEKKIIDFFPVEEKIDLEKQVIAKILDVESVYAYSCTEYVKDIGTPERLKKVEIDLINGVCEQRNLKNKQKCIFLDRDGTINKHVGFLFKPEQVELEYGVAEAIRSINESEYLAIVVSNQPVVARGECSVEMLRAIHNRLDTLLGIEGAFLDDLYYCPHHPDKGFEGEVPELKVKCDCRKPNIGMIQRAVLEHNIDLENSWIVGDTTMDLQTGKNAGIRTALVLTGEAGRDGKYKVEPNIVANYLGDCVRKIINDKKENANEE